MPRIPQGPAQKGSQKWIQKVINENPELINSCIRTQLDLPGTENISWYSPLAEDEFAEYQDQAFLDLLDIKLPEASLADFWPQRGPCWDALGKSDTRDIFLVEAKSHVPEMLSPGTGAGAESLRRIKGSLNETKAYLNSQSEHDWSSTFYQYTNRLAHLYLLRVLNRVPAYIVFVYFVNDKDMNGPQSIDEWNGALSLLTSYFGIGRHRLKKYIADIFIDLRLLLNTSA